jgi:hypothetical protein
VISISIVGYVLFTGITTLLKRIFELPNGMYWYTAITDLFHELEVNVQEYIRNLSADHKIEPARVRSVYLLLRRQRTLDFLKVKTTLSGLLYTL